MYWFRRRRQRRPTPHHVPCLQTWGYGSYDKAGVTTATMRGAFNASLEGGVNLFDTAESCEAQAAPPWKCGSQFAPVLPAAVAADYSRLPCLLAFLGRLATDRACPLTWQTAAACLAGGARRSAS